MFFDLKKHVMRGLSTIRFSFEINGLHTRDKKLCTSFHFFKIWRVIPFCDCPSSWSYSVSPNAIIRITNNYSQTEISFSIRELSKPHFSLIEIRCLSFAIWNWFSCLGIWHEQKRTNIYSTLCFLASYWQHSSFVSLLRNPVALFLIQIWHKVSGSRLNWVRR